MARLPFGILPHPRNSRDMPFMAYRRRDLLDLLAAFGLAQHALQRMSQALGLLLGSALQASPSNPALRILLRAFVKACDAFHGIA